MKLLTRSEAKKELHVHQNTLYNWEKQGILKPNRIGKRVYYTEEKILQALNSSAK